jgi:hypothetical protein
MGFNLWHYYYSLKQYFGSGSNPLMTVSPPLGEGVNIPYFPPPAGGEIFGSADLTHRQHFYQKSAVQQLCKKYTPFRFFCP